MDNLPTILVIAGSSQNAAIARSPQWLDIIISFQWLAMELPHKPMLHPLKI